MSAVILPPNFDPEELLRELEETLRRIHKPSPKWREALVIMRREDLEQCSAEEFANTMGL